MYYFKRNNRINQTTMKNKINSENKCINESQISLSKTKKKNNI